MRPGAKALACAQDRINEKTLARELGAMTAEFAPIDSLEALSSTLDGGFSDSGRAEDRGASATTAKARRRS